ncbi:hypothetical protein VCHC48A1_3322, partial [Vibrio cholerae HC-48A1]
MAATVLIRQPIAAGFFFF